MLLDLPLRINYSRYIGIVSTTLKLDKVSRLPYETSYVEILIIIVLKII